MTPTQEEINRIKWWHRIDLGNGVVTPGCCNSEPKLAYSLLPEHMDGFRVLDIGAWDGWWSFLCEKRGAAEVVAVDTWGFDTGRQGFDLAKRALDSRVIPIYADVHNLRPDLPLSDGGVLGTFDLVLCLGALHHFKSPLLALERIRSVCKYRLILETHLDLLDVPKSACAFYQERDVYNDPTILWGPNERCVNAWLKRAGFKRVYGMGLIPKTWEGGGARETFHAYVTES